MHYNIVADHRDVTFYYIIIIINAEIKVTLSQ